MTIGERPDRLACQMDLSVETGWPEQVGIVGGVGVSVLRHGVRSLAALLHQQFVIFCHFASRIPRIAYLMFKVMHSKHYISIFRKLYPSQKVSPIYVHILLYIWCVMC